MLSPAHQPIPLPQEKFLLTLPAISLSLFPCPPGAALTVSPPKDGSHLQAQGKLYASNQRVVFVAAEEKAGKQGALQSLSVPYSHFQDGRFKQPIFSAAYYEALCLPADGGGLSVRLLLLSIILSDRRTLADQRRIVAGTSHLPLLLPRSRRLPVLRNSRGDEEPARRLRSRYTSRSSPFALLFSSPPPFPC